MDNHPDSPLWRIFNTADNLIDQPYEGRGLSLVVCSIRHYVLDGTSTNILFKSGTKNQVVPFDGYDLLVSDGKFRTIFALADLRLSSLIQKKILTPGSVISRVSVRICYSERMSRHRFFLVTDLSFDPERTVHKVDIDKLVWLSVFDQVHFNQPLLSLRINYTSIWNITDPVGSCWEANSSAILRITDSKAVPRGYTLTQMLRNQHGKNLSPLLVRVFAKSRLNYFARKTGKRLDLNTCPYQFDALVADESSCCLAVFWGELAVQAYRHIEIGSVLLICGYRIKQSFKTVDYSAFCFNPAIERFGLEISLNDKLLNGKFPFDLVQPGAILENSQIAQVPFNFIPISSLNHSPSALNEIKLDFAGVLVYAGRWHREARRFFRDTSENESNQAPQDESVTEGIVVSSVSGDKYLEEFNTGGFWMWRWLILTDETCESDPSSTVLVKFYCTSQPDLQYHLQPSDPIAITQLRVIILNKSEAVDSRFQPKWSLTTSNESQLAVITKLGSDSPFLREGRVVRVREFAANGFKSMLAFGGFYDYPPYPATFEALVNRFRPSPNKPPEQQIAREIVGPIYVAAPQLETLIDGFAFLEQRCLLVHALLVSVRYLPFDEVVGRASSHIGGEMSRKRKLVEDNNDSSGNPRLILASAWEERKVGFRSLGIESPHWRTLTWHWQSRSSEFVLKKCVNLPNELADFEDSSAGGSRIHLNPVSNCAGFLHIQLLCVFKFSVKFNYFKKIIIYHQIPSKVLNQSVYVNCLVPVPESCSTGEFVSHFSASDPPGVRVAEFVNSCCDSYKILPEKTSSTRKQADLVTKTVRQFFANMSTSSPTSPAKLAPRRTSAVLACYGLGADGVEIALKHLYPLS